MTTRTFVVTVVLTSVHPAFTVMAAQLPGRHFAPDYDLRLAFDTEVVRRLLGSMFPNRYGDIVRLNEAPVFCGDKGFIASLSDEPRFVLSGDLNTQMGRSSARMRLSVDLDARFSDECWGVGGSRAHLDLSTKLEQVSGLNDFELRGTGKLRPYGSNPIAAIAGLLGISVDASHRIQMPAGSLASIPIRLGAQGQTQLDFGTFCRLCPGSWVSSGREKLLPIIVDAGALPTSSTDASGRYLVLDLTFGETRFLRPFQMFRDAWSAYISDNPIHISDGVSRNIGLSIRESALSRVDVCGTGNDAFDSLANCNAGRGLFRELLPIRVRGRHHVTDQLDLEYSIILTGAQVRPITINGLPGRDARLLTRYAALRTITKTSSGEVASRPWMARKVEAGLRLDNLRIEDGDLRLRVRDFSLDIEVGRIGLPLKISTGDLSGLINDTKIPLGLKTQLSQLNLPDCLPLDVKFKARDWQCGHPGKASGVLSREGNPGSILRYATSSTVVKDGPILSLSGQFTVEPRPDLPVDVVTWLESGTPVIVTRWRSNEPGRLGETQCGNIGGTRFVAIGSWSDPIRMDTDQRSGRCDLEWGIIDPKDSLNGLAIDVTWTPSNPNEPGQCKGNHGVRRIPITLGIPRDEGRISFSDVIVVDTDDASGGCFETFALGGRNDVALDIKFHGDDEPSQCVPHLPDTHLTVAYGGPPVTLFVDTDRRWGGCVQQLRLRKQ
jgi:hypothetical protein